MTFAKGTKILRRHFNHGMVWSLTVVGTLVGCGADKTLPVKNSSPSTATAPAPTVQTPNVPVPAKPADKPSNDVQAVTEDKSLTTDEYTEMGMPSPDRTWNSSDMETVSKLITQISKDDPSKLPRYQSAKSGEVFQRIVNNQNLDLLRNPLLPNQVRMQEALKFTQAANGVNVAYVSGLLARTTGDNEMTEISGLILRTSVVMIELVNQFLPSLDPKSPTYPTRIDGLKKMKSGMANVMLGSIKQISEPGTWKAEPLGRFIGYMDETFPIIITALTPGLRKETLTQLEKLGKDPGLKNNKQAFDELVSKVARVVNDASNKQ